MAPSSLESRVAKVKKEDGMVRAPTAPPNRHGFSAPSTNKRKSRKPTKQQGSQRAAFSPPQSTQVHSFRAASQPADSCSASLRSPLSTDPPDCSCSVAGVHVESDFPLFFFLSPVVVGKPAGQPLSVPWMAAHLPAGWMDGCHRTRAPELARPFLYQPAIPMLEEGGSQNKSPPPVWWVVFSPRRARSAFGTVPREIDRGKQGKHECLAYIHAA